MKGFCSGSSIEIELELNKAEIADLRDRTLTGNIRRGIKEMKKLELNCWLVMNLILN